MKTELAIFRYSYIGVILYYVDAETYKKDWYSNSFPSYDQPCLITLVQRHYGFTF